MSVVNNYHPADLGAMTLIGHLQELRKRLLISIIAFGITSSISYFFSSNLVQLLISSVNKVYFLNPAEAFFTYLKVSAFSGFILALPLIMQQAWSFVGPALTEQERKVFSILIPASYVLFLAGITFSYFLVLPAGIKFFLSFATDELQPLFSLGQYLSFVISFLLPFGFIFEIPLIIIGLAYWRIISSLFLVKKRKIILVLAFIIGAIISPTPDIFSQTMVAVPIVLLYEISLFIVKYGLHK
ncbi:MAG: tatC [Firmicutes bacterium]|nr:tatC [Bacillota bacterium]